MLLDTLLHVPCCCLGIKVRINKTPTPFTIGLSLVGSNASPDRGMVFYNGLPLCDDNSFGDGVWDLDDATVVCRMLGFSKAAKEYNDNIASVLTQQFHGRVQATGHTSAT